MVLKKIWPAAKKLRTSLSSWYELKCLKWTFVHGKLIYKKKVAWGQYRHCKPILWCHPPFNLYEMYFYNIVKQRLIFAVKLKLTLNVCQIATQRFNSINTFFLHCFYTYHEYKKHRFIPCGRPWAASEGDDTHKAICVG